MLNIDRPALFDNESGIVAGFTQRNRIAGRGKLIEGLHFNGSIEEERAAVYQHYALVSQEIHVAPATFTWVTQVHGDGIVYADRTGSLGEGDALFTDRTDILLSIRVADCAAVLLADASAGVIAAAHAGWRGARLNIVSKTIQKMIGAGAEPGRIKTFISPCISTSQFEVGEEVAGEFPEVFVHRTGFSKPHIDLKGFLRQELLANGLESENLEIDNRCTVEEADSLFSYRREGKISGRMIGFIGLRSA